MKLKPILALLCAVLLIVLLFGCLHDRKIQKGFTAIAPHASEDAVRQALGDPSSVDKTCQAYGTQVTENCDHVLIYKSAFQPLKPTYWLVFFDAANTAVATSRQARP